MKRIWHSHLAIKIVCICLIAVALVSIVSFRLQLNDAEEKKAQLEEEKEALEERIEQVKYELERPIDDEYIIKVARERLGYHLPGEKVYVFDDSDE